MTERKSGKTSKGKIPQGLLRSNIFKLVLAVSIFFFIGTSATVLYFYNYYSRIIDRRLSGEVFKNTAKIYAAPYRIYPGQKVTLEQIVARLQRAGFEEQDKAPSDDGYYEIAGNKLTINPSVGDAMRIEFQKNSLSRIVKLKGNQVEESWLPAELVTNLFDETRQKRRIVEFKELPPHLVNALVASEDRRFFNHWGLDPVRLTGAIIDYGIRDRERIEGTSTLTQQLARNFFLTLDRSPVRKAQEIFIALMLEQRLSKEQILTMYANDVYLGQRGSFSIRGLAEGAAAYFGKDLGQITLAEAATLVGMIPAPNAYSPTKNPERAKTRRNVVLNAMRELNMVTPEEFETARDSEMRVAPIKVDATDAPYLVDFIREELQKDFTEEDLINNNLRIYTTLDPELQRAAVEAVEKGLQFVEEQFAALDKGKKNPPKRPSPQAALIALDPHTGEIKAMVGGSDYGASQYNRITEAFRQPGSIFKPFVYAAAFEEAFGDEPLPREKPAGEEPAESNPAPSVTPPAEAAADPQTETPPLTDQTQTEVITPLTVFMDEPTTFLYDGEKIYEPNNYKQQYRGVVTVRTALQHSLNIPTIKVAERIGYERVAQLARRAGLNAKIKGYPSVALGAFEVTPLEMAGAYTIFANEGQRMQPHALVRVIGPDGSTTKAYVHKPQAVIRPELAYLMTNLLEGVVNRGTGAGVRGRGFYLPAAGKTGTSRDGWFAGYTKDFLTIAWVGFDDNSDLTLEGSRSALPIWTEFMKKAVELYPPRDPDNIYFNAPEGIEFARVDRETQMIATPQCIDTFDEVFLAGTVPNTYCPIHTSLISEFVGPLENAGEGIGKTLRGLGRFFGRVFKK
ncbi:MAG: transglycosylase domain-containing protein [Acidobacteria bacterium]|nr:transglycosylase domain-containing protein [Acidobacteriota bacterium]